MDSQCLLGRRLDLQITLLTNGCQVLVPIALAKQAERLLSSFIIFTIQSQVYIIAD